MAVALLPYQRTNSISRKRSASRLKNYTYCRQRNISYSYACSTLGISLLGPVLTSNIVEATFDTVERIVQLVAFDNVVSTLLIVSDIHNHSTNCGLVPPDFATVFYRIA